MLGICIIINLFFSHWDLSTGIGGNFFKLNLISGFVQLCSNGKISTWRHPCHHMLVLIIEEIMSILHINRRKYRQTGTTSFELLKYLPLKA